MRKFLPSKPGNKESQVPGQKKQKQSQEQLILFPKAIKKEALFVTFTGTIEDGNFDEHDQLTIFYSLVHGNDWQIKAGQKSGISQIAASNGSKIVWNLPFEISYSTTYLVGWPQLIITIYGTDYFGRSLVQGYGNIHLPTTQGKKKRKIKIFQPLPQSVISGFFGYLNGCIAEYREHEKILGSGEGRQVTRVKNMGQVDISIQVIRHNFLKYGYQ